MKKKVHVLISGRVQGVWFRASTRNQALQLGIKGWVKNTSDEKVEAVFEGEEDKIKKMILWCKSGPKHAHVTNIKINHDESLEDFKKFNIIY
jgi:acylphosphatase